MESATNSRMNANSLKCQLLECEFNRENSQTLNAYTVILVKGTVYRWLLKVVPNLNIRFCDIPLDKVISLCWTFTICYDKKQETHENQQRIGYLHSTIRF